MRADAARRGLLLCALLCAALPAQAHNRSVSYSTWMVEDAVLHAQVRLPGVELNRASLHPQDPRILDELAARVRDGFVPSSAAGRCTDASAEARRSGADFIVEARWRCDGPPQQIEKRFLLDAIAGHLHLLQMRSGDGLIGPFALSAARPRVTVGAQGAAVPEPAFSRYLWLGTEHILIGWDHLAFLVVLLLGAASLRQLAWRITGFTVGHSATLILATLGAVQPPALMVESFIALTIACFAAERVLAGQGRAAVHIAMLTGALALVGWIAGALPLPLAAAAVLLSLGGGLDTRLDSLRTGLFGLFHGFGFAGVLGELNAGQAVPALPLAGFNLGVELGQLLFVLPLWWLARRWPALHRPWLPALMLALGCAWFFQRIA
ncbi:MAG: HupE/UreJ family protein [Sinimarinibacterium flocculans]|uniref:HupE/UreJ family protein n=1 Tax=Sinimarinibacterium flocculans TaxID=985250 RepID=UPI003C51E4F7